MASLTAAVFNSGDHHHHHRGGDQHHHRGGDQHHRREDEDFLKTKQNTIKHGKRRKLLLTINFSLDLVSITFRIKRKEVPVTKQPEKNSSSWSLSEDGFEHG